jgi:hypothetical protein
MFMLYFFLFPTLPFVVYLYLLFVSFVLCLSLSFFISLIGKPER